MKTGYSVPRTVWLQKLEMEADVDWLTNKVKKTICAVCAHHAKVISRCLYLVDAAYAYHFHYGTYGTKQVEKITLQASPSAVFYTRNDPRKKWKIVTATEGVLIYIIFWCVQLNTPPEHFIALCMNRLHLPGRKQPDQHTEKQRHGQLRRVRHVHSRRKADLMHIIHNEAKEKKRKKIVSKIEINLYIFFFFLTFCLVGWRFSFSTKSAVFHGTFSLSYVISPWKSSSKEEKMLRCTLIP